MFEKIKNFFNINVDKINNDILLELQETMKEAEDHYNEVYRWKEDYKKLYNKYKEKNRELLAKERVLEANNEIAKVMSYWKISDFQEKIYDILEILGENLKVDRCYIYKYDSKESKFDLFLQGRKEKIQGKPLSHGSLFWLDLFSRKQIICGKTEDFSIEEKEILRPQQIESICLVPIFILDYFGGFIGFDSCLEEREGFYEEEKALQNTADIIGMSLCSKAIFDKMVEKKTLLEESLCISKIYMWRKDHNKIYIDVNEAFNNEFFDNESDGTLRTIDQMARNLFVDEETKKEWKEMVEVTDSIAMNSNSGVHFYEIYNNNGELRILDVIKNPWFSRKSGKLEGLVGIGDDKTEESGRILGTIKNSNTVKSIYNGNLVQAYQVNNDNFG